MHFPYAVVISLFVFATCSYLLYHFLGHYTGQDKYEYERLINGDAEQDAPVTRSQQSRLGVQKNLYFIEGGEPRLLELKSARSEFVLEKQRGHFAVMEHFQGVEGTLQASSVCAGKGAYDGKTLSFQENVIFKTSWGEAAADEAIMRIIDGDSKKPFDKVDLHGHVKLNFSRGGVLKCSDATFDAHNLTGTFSCSSEGDVVEYHETRTDGQSLMVASRAMHVHVHEDEDKQIALEMLHAQGNVIVKYGDGFSAICDEMRWVDAEHKMTLLGNVTVKQEEIGELYTQDEMHLTFAPVDRKKVLQTIDTTGKTTFVFIDSSVFLKHTLVSYGIAKVDHTKKEVKLLSPKDTLGEIISDKQIYFEDAKGEIYADRAYVKYDDDEGRLTPLRIILEGHVTISNCLAPSGEKADAAQQYVLSDSVELLPVTGEMVLKGAKGRRVLLFDKADHLQVSAPMLTLQRGQAAQKELVQGIGDVRLGFTKQELDKIRCRFPFESRGITEALKKTK